MATSKSHSRHKSSAWVENIKTIVYAALIALVVRTVAYEPFNIPSGSMKPTLLVGDYLFVAKYSYGYSHYSLPFSPDLFSGRIFFHMPARGDVAVFKYPRNPSEDYIKRIIGLPGDTVQMREGQLYVNGKLVPRKPVGNYTDNEGGIRIVLKEYQETLPPSDHHAAVKHDILKATDQGAANNTPVFKVPPGDLFVMGDNRDNSDDSRFWGYVPMTNLVGKAEIIFFSFNAKYPWWEFWEWPFEIRWDRLMTMIN